MKTTLWWPLLLATTLAACGGSSDGGGDDSGPNPPPPPPPPPPPITIAVETYLQSQCGAESPLADVDLVVHRADGSILSTAKTGSDGTLDLVWPDGAAHLTVAGQSVSGSGVSGADIITLIDWDSGDPGRFTFSDNSSDEGCQCTSVILDGSEIAAQYSGMDLVYTVRTSGGTSTRYLYGSETIALCANNGEWTPVDLMLVSAYGSNEAYAATLDMDFSTQERVVIQPSWFEGEAHQGQLVDLVVNDNYGYSYSFAETPIGRQHYYFASPDESIFHFPGLHEHNLVQAYEFIGLGSEVEGTAAYMRASRDRIRDGAASLVLPLTQNQFVDEATRILVGMSEGGEVAEYDFSQIGEGRNLLTVTLMDNATNNNWRVEAPLAGTLPELELPTLYLELLGTMEAPELVISSYGYHQDLDLHDYRRQVRTLVQQGGQRSEFFDRYVYETLIVMPNLP